MFERTALRRVCVAHHKTLTPGQAVHMQLYELRVLYKQPELKAAIRLARLRCSAQCATYVEAAGGQKPAICKMNGKRKVVRQLKRCIQIGGGLTLRTYKMYV